MCNAAVSADFDAAALADLLSAAFTAWCVTAIAEAGKGPALSARVRCADGRKLRVVRIDDGERELPAWCHGPVDMPLDAAPRSASLPALLAELRMDLDCEYAPHRLVMGARYSPDR